MELSYRLMGRYRGGGAKVACLSSGLFGMISGSIVGNVVYHRLYDDPNDEAIRL